MADELGRGEADEAASRGRGSLDNFGRRRRGMPRRSCTGCENQSGGGSEIMAHVT